MFGAPAGNGRDVQAIGVHEPGLGVGHRDDPRADRVELGGGDRADVAEALDRDARLADVHADALADGLGHVDDPQAGGLAAPRRAPEHDRLARDDLEDRVAHHLRVRVHEPRHLALARAHVGRRDVAIGADDGDELGGVAAREALELADAQVMRRAAHAALGAAVGQPEQRALPRHPHRQRGAFAERDVGAVAKAALRRAHRQRVLHAVAGEAEHLAGVHPNGEVHDERAARLAEAGHELGIELEQRAGAVELVGRDPVELRSPLVARGDVVAVAVVVARGRCRAGQVVHRHGPDRIAARLIAA